MNRAHPNDPLHGITLETIVTRLVETLGWEEMGRRVKVRCFTHDPSVSSSLKFLRRTPWARAEVERLYLASVRLPGGGEDSAEARFSGSPGETQSS